MLIKKSEPKYHSELSEIAKKSKRFWGYSDEWMHLWDEDLTLTQEYIATNEVWHIENESEDIIGFYSFYRENEDFIRLDFLFIKPEYIGYGYGKLLINHFFSQAKLLADKIVLDADPYAEEFYQKFGFKTVENKPTKIEGRFLPVMSKII
ncbi:GNAT family N-acetyltransferase [Elizabethkingia anophelis]|uniref:GNAT family N-acetyltransferase n=1 Tax=Elizabethkingia anophelis TaxID=1117645 RepID=A0AAE4P203_9FLAO|nr:GNAT family N-acetyltransferase [Elizabethkingia anophelis]MCT3762661.1 GNAT family N-acetyltransferase [Elizabethkingia anophelis]MCT3919719.1 GNAT family N-acetyltransferase [Elizabethkingia anophelis]MCT3952074.1 GNAT family N-acetyltransferase [Elizabethkingia anophelis]MCT3955617.1 GNAT family N-acetyltransferase [Elizabethkingia anophelis]MCT3987204.1 GNAT family N-acetyltransferase [Elizabethkingia anophelis]